MPDSSAEKVCDSLVKKAVTPSTPAAPSAPADPEVPPSILKIVVVSDNPSLLATIVTGKLVLSLSSPPALNAPANVKLPLTTPLYNGGVEEFAVTLPVSKSNPVTEDPPAVVIVISLADILAVKFC